MKLPLAPIKAFARSPEVGERLDALLAHTDPRARLLNDPLELPHRYAAPDDIEIAALLSSALAYGRVDLFKPRLTTLLESLGPHPSHTARTQDRKALLARTRGFSYRMTGPEEIVSLLLGAGRLQTAHGSLGAAFTERFNEAKEPTVQTALGLFIDDLITKKASRRLKHLLPHPSRGSACKRMNLFLRWMVRGPDGTDFGLWRGIPKTALVIPLDTHVHRISRLLGLTRRTDLSWRTAEEITARLRALDADDPVKFDFALSHHGISGDCPARRDERKCSPCQLKSVCRAWR